MMSSMIDFASLATLGFWLILAGLITAFVAVIILLFSSTSDEQKVRGGGVVIIGFLPIVFGTDRESVKVLLALAIVLVVLVILVNIVFDYL